MIHNKIHNRQCFVRSVHVVAYRQHKKNFRHEYLSQHVYISLLLNESLHHIHMAIRCSQHESCDSITLKTKTAVMSLLSIIQTSAAVDRQNGMLAVINHVILPVTCSNIFWHCTHVLMRPYVLTLVLLTNAPALSSRSVISRCPLIAASISGDVPPYVCVQQKVMIFTLPDQGHK